jgi:hypothetical protein
LGRTSNRVRPETQKNYLFTNMHVGAVPYLRRLVTGFPQQQLDSIPGQVMWDLQWTKWHWNRFPPSTSVSSANSHSIKYSIHIYHPELVHLAN